MKKKCLVCNKEFHIYPSEIKYGRGKYCSIVCRANSKKSGETRSCKTCKKEFYVSRSQIKYRGVFCSKRCIKKGITKICPQCNKNFYVIPCFIRTGRGNYCSYKCFCEHPISEETREKQSISHKEDKSYTWRGGITPQIKVRVATLEWRTVKRYVLERDQQTCQRCFKQDIVLHVHHKIPYRISQNDSLDNLITLCLVCHAIIEHEYRRKEIAYA